MDRRHHMVDEFVRPDDRGFTLVELVVAVLIIGILVSISIPVYQGVQSHTKQKACFSNQRLIEGAANTWAAENAGNLPALQGVVDRDHPLVFALIFRRPPRCPSAPEPAHLEYPDASTGAYTLDASGCVSPCAFGGHGYYDH